MNPKKTNGLPIMQDSIPLEELSLDAAIAMSKNGARVLQLEALEFAKKSNITLVANATKKPSGAGTRLVSSEIGREPLAISFDRQVVRLCDPSKDSADPSVIHQMIGLILA